VDVLVRVPCMFLLSNGTVLITYYRILLSYAFSISNVYSCLLALPYIVYITQVVVIQYITTALVSAIREYTCTRLWYRLVRP
jgi:hypothetical protein